MKRVLLLCFLLTVVFSVHNASAQAVTQASFTIKVNALDSLIGAGDMTDAQTMWASVHADALTVLAVSKSSIANASSPAIGSSYMTILQNQTSIYSTIWRLHTDLATNRVALHANLAQFDATIY